MGGPNIPPDGDGPIAECIANAPGGPVHVLLSDGEAEHIPGCNMAFRRAALKAIGGFDPQFRTAGDDVDICWRLQQQGWTIGFSPGAMVWHHRRNSVRTYWKQQQGYGKAEALLERKWPEKYNAAGHVTWAGRVYGKGLASIFGRGGRIYHGIWGAAPFQSIYQPAPGLWGSLVASFLASGAPSVVASLWSTKDRVGRELSERFYAEGGTREQEDCGKTAHGPLNLFSAAASHNRKSSARPARSFGWCPCSRAYRIARLRGRRRGNCAGTGRARRRSGDGRAASCRRP